MQQSSANKILPSLGLGLMMLLGVGNANALGTLAINIEPNNTAGARVIVIGPVGPNAKVRSVTADRRLSLPAGRYQVFTPGVRRAAPIVDSVFGIVNKPVVNIVNGQSVPLLARFDRLRPGSGRLWLPVRLDGQVQSFARAQLAAGGDRPGIAITGAGDEPINAIFDPRGNMWVASFADNTLLRYSPRKLAAPGGARVPDIIIRSNTTGSLNGPLGLAFDAKGNLWVGNYGPRTGSGGAGDNTIVRFTRGQLARSGAPTPAIILRGFDNPYGHIFDAQGNLWVANSRADNVLRFPPAQLKNGGTPDVTITETSVGGVLDGPRGVTFDRNGNLWVASAVNERVAGYTVSGTTVTPLSTVTLRNEQGGRVPSPDGLAFDNAGFLWVTATDGNLYRYSKASVEAGGVKQPVTTISSFGRTRGVLMSFNPKPRPLPANP
ncbi:MAG: NHL repeat-containing protein [Gammaproteobacteria bacterium]